MYILCPDKDKVMKSSKWSSKWMKFMQLYSENFAPTAQQEY